MHALNEFVMCYYPSITTRGAETILSLQFIENRRKAFVSQRHDFVNPHPPEKSNRRCILLLNAVSLGCTQSGYHIFTIFIMIVE